MATNVLEYLNTSVNTPIPSLPAAVVGKDRSFSDAGKSDCHGVWYDAVLVVPSVVFLVYLAVHAKKNLKKLSNGRSYIMISYYALVWVATLVNLAWCSLQGWQCSAGKAVAWNLLSLFTASAIMCLEISLVAFLLQDNYTSGVQALAQTFLVSGIIVTVDLLLKEIYSGIESATDQVLKNNGYFEQAEEDTLSILGFFHKKLVPTSASTYCQNRWKLGKNYNDQFVRVRFSGPGSNTNKEQGSDPIKERKPSFQQAESLDNKGKNWSRMQFPREMSQDYDSQDSEFATAVAAAVFAIHSIEDAELQYEKERRKSLEISRTNSMQDIMTGRPSSGGVTRRLSNKGATNAGEASMKKPMGQDQRTLESVFPSRYPNRTTSTRPSTPADRNQNRKGNSRGHGYAVESKADAWEKAQMKKIQNRYEKVKAAILAWENEKKMQVKTKMERRKRELEQRRARNLQHYQVKQERIDHIAGGARAQVEEKRRNEESKVKEKVKRIGATGKVPVTCFCFTCY